MKLLELRGITKRFAHTVALDNVDFDLLKGEVHALLGENGAGKTTLVSIISGVYQPDSGQILLEGKPVTLKSPRDAYRRGIVLVPQHPALPESLTVYEALALFLDKSPSRKLKTFIEERLRKFGIEVDLDKRISLLTPYEKVKVEIAKALVADAKIYIFDEATSLLGHGDRELLYKIIRTLCAEGRGVIYITHRIDEVFNIADRVTVLRKGRKVLTRRINEVTREELLEAMFGKKLEEYAGPRSASTHGEGLAVENLTVQDDYGRLAVRNVTLSVKYGEIVTILAAPGAGHREFLEAIVGLRKPVSGRVKVNGIDVTGRDPSFIRRMGVAYIPDDRLGLGVAPGLAVKWNLVMRDLDKFTTKVGTFHKFLNDALVKVLEKVGLAPDVLPVPCAELSGGQIQRIITARELFLREVKVIVALNPFYGLDYETTSLLRKTLIDLRNSGCAILVATEDIEEAVKLGDRILVMREGKILKEFSGSTVSARELAKVLTL